MLYFTKTYSTARFLFFQLFSYPRFDSRLTLTYETHAQYSTDRLVFLVSYLTRF